LNRQPLLVTLAVPAGQAEGAAHWRLIPLMAPLLLQYQQLLLQQLAGSAFHWVGLPGVEEGTTPYHQNSTVLDRSGNDRRRQHKEKQKKTLEKVKRQQTNRQNWQ